ncbi:MAG: prepilin-type N-terminal cleavage/methylation domain-containing protein [Agathobacter sp.]|nr:prepilin-type N-terminal cleavage/methylation domain-containing protein [Agathobacter sp.]
MEHYYRKKKETTKRANNRGFSLVELIIVIAIMAVLVGVLTPMFTSYLHKSRVATDWANLRNYFSEIQADFTETGKHNPLVPTDPSDLNFYNRTEITFLDGRTVQMKDGVFFGDNKGAWLSDCILLQ